MNTQSKTTTPVSIDKEQKIKHGDRVYHKLIKQFLTVVSDEKGPAYTGEEFKDDEISLSHALTELKNGNLSIDKEVLETGNWFENEWRKLEQKGYNPASVVELYRALEHCLDALESHKRQLLYNGIDPAFQSDFAIQHSKTALSSAKL